MIIPIFIGHNMTFTINTLNYPNKLMGITYGTGLGENLHDYITRGNQPTLTVEQQRTLKEKVVALFDMHRIDKSSDMVCPCGKSKTAFKETARNHQLVMHIKYEAFGCFFCGKTYQAEKQIKRHQRKVHSELIENNSLTENNSLIGNLKRAPADSQYANSDVPAKKQKTASESQQSNSSTTYILPEGLTAALLGDLTTD